MKNTILYLILLSFCSCEVIDDPVDTGNFKSDKSKTLWEYFTGASPDNWELLVEAIEYAGIKHVFDGSDPNYKEITCFGVTNYSIEKFLYENGMRNISDLSPEACKAMVLSHLIPGKYLKNTFDFEVRGTNEGGSIFTTLTGKSLRIYRIKTPGPYGPESGPTLLGIHAPESGFKASVASEDIEVKNGVVHALAYDYIWNEL